MNLKGKGWTHPGHRSSHYGKTYFNDHDHRRTWPKNYKKSDLKIYEDVCEELYWNPDVDASEIEVSVADGIVTLKGKVDSRHAKKMAERISDCVIGVEDVRNLLTIGQTLDIESDKTITRGEDGLFTQESHQR